MCGTCVLVKNVLLRSAGMSAVFFLYLIVLSGGRGGGGILQVKNGAPEGGPCTRLVLQPRMCCLGKDYLQLAPPKVKAKLPREGLPNSLLPQTSRFL